MSRARKTYKVSEVVDKANKFFEKSTCSADARQMVACFVADILHETNNYVGFVYLDSETDMQGAHYGEDGRIKFLK